MLGHFSIFILAANNSELNLVDPLSPVVIDVLGEESLRRAVLNKRSIVGETEGK
jgi:hypothetical protein